MNELLKEILLVSGYTLLVGFLIFYTFKCARDSQKEHKENKI